MQEKAKEIYMTFLSSKASSQVNVEGQSRLSETILETPHPLMFQKLQDQVKLFTSITQFHSFFSGFNELCFLAMAWIEQVSTELGCCHIGDINAAALRYSRFLALSHYDQLIKRLNTIILIPTQDFPGKLDGVFCWVPVWVTWESPWLTQCLRFPVYSLVLSHCWCLFL